MSKINPMTLDLKSDKTEYLSDDEIINFFEPSPEMDEITKIRNTYIVGHKGSGKSFVLKYLSLPLQIMRMQQSTMIEFDKKAFGILISCNVGRFGGMTEDPELNPIDRNWIKTFTHTFNLCVLEILLNSLDVLYNKVKSISIDELNNFIDKISKELKLSDKKITYEQALNLIDNQISDLQDDYDGNNFVNTIQHYSKYTFLHTVRKYFQSCFKNLKNIEPIFLFDEYNELSNGQQKVINEMIRLRQPVFKMTTLPKSYVIERIREGEQK